ncbi:MAG: sulfotransferase [Spongiibacteraceae bacterium]
MIEKLTVTGLEAAACDATGLSDFGPDTGWREGFVRLVDAVEAMNPNEQLRELATHNIVGQLTTRLHFTEDDKNHPDISQQAIGNPLIVIGLPRTGTTISYDLLCLDPEARAPREWEWYLPWPPPETATFDSNPRIAQVSAMYDNWLQHAPQLLDIQRFDCTQPGECNHGMQYHFGSTNFPAELGVPDYAQWLRENDVTGQYISHKRLLQNFQWKGPKGRWTLKSPQHLFDLPALLEAYPGAMLVWTHRDPALTFSSLSSFIAGFLAAFGGDKDKAAIGRDVVETWISGMNRALAARADPAIEARIIDLAHKDVVADPKGVVQRIYDKFDLNFSDQHKARIDNFLIENPAAKRMGKHRHSPEEYSIDITEVRERMSDYYDRFGHLLGRPDTAGKL